MQRFTVIVTVILSLSFAAWALYSKHQTDRLALSMLYLDSATHIKNNLYILSSLREGDNRNAINHLEQLLDTKVAILRGCKYDLCTDSMPKEYSEMLMAYEAHQNKFNKE